MAQRIDQIQLVNKAFQSNQRQLSLQPVPAHPLPLLVVCPLPIPASSPPVRPAPAAPVLLMATNVDVTRKVQQLPLKDCYCYRDINHLVRDCSYCLDMKQLTTEQQEELIEDLLALKDSISEKKKASSRGGFCVE